jgi:hypothetical protein
MKIEKSIAIKEFERWFESKKLSSTKRGENDEDMQKVEDELICAISDGKLIVEDDNKLTLNLQWPLDLPSGTLDKLTFVHRISAGELQSKTSHVKPKDAQGRITASIAALTGEVGGTIRALSDVDYSTASCIATYFF